MLKRATDVEHSFKDEVKPGSLASVTLAEKRESVASNLREKFPNKVPVIVEKSSKEKNLPDIPQTKYAASVSKRSIYRFLIPEEFTYQQF